MKKLFDKSVIKGVVEVTEQQASFYNQEPSALIVGTTVVVPAQKAHIKMRTIAGNELATKSLFAYVLDKDGKLMETKEISLSQFQRRSYGTGEMIIRAITNENGLLRGEAKATESNIIGKKPEFKVVVENGKNILVLASSVAYNVTRGDVHNMAQVADQRADGRYDFKTKMMGGVEILDLDTRRLPNLESVAVPTGYASIPEEVKEYSL